MHRLHRLKSEEKCCVPVKTYVRGFRKICKKMDKKCQDGSGSQGAIKWKLEKGSMAMSLKPIHVLHTEVLKVVPAHGGEL